MKPLSRETLLAVGKCCGNRCVNCPYVPTANKGNTKTFCHYCCRLVNVVEIHGHLQCELCKINIQPCCSGET